MAGCAARGRRCTARPGAARGRPVHGTAEGCVRGPGHGAAGCRQADVADGTRLPGGPRSVDRGARTPRGRPARSGPRREANSPGRQAGWHQWAGGPSHSPDPHDPGTPVAHAARRSRQCPAPPHPQNPGTRRHTRTRPPSTQASPRHRDRLALPGRPRPAPPRTPSTNTGGRGRRPMSPSPAAAGVAGRVSPSSAPCPTPPRPPGRAAPGPSRRPRRGPRWWGPPGSGRP